jgi:phosphate transport system substrate-binding protein
MKRFFLAAGTLILAVCLAGGTAFAGMLQVNGSTTVLPVAQKVAEAYMKEFPDVKISISGGGSGNGIKALVDGTTDIAMSSRFIKDKEVKMAVDNGRYPVPFGIAYDCIVPVVHPSNTVANLTAEQLKGIYMGAIRNWSEVGGPDKSIVVVSRDTSSGTYEVWEEKILNKEKVTPAALLQASSGAVHQAVAGNKYAVGYLGVGYLSGQVKAITVNGVTGNADTARTGLYPVSRVLYMFTNNWPAGDALNFLNYMMNPAKGQKLVLEEGFVPLY